MSARPSILLGVTVDTSLILMRGFPEYLRDDGWDVHVVSAPGPQLDQLAGITGVSAHAVPMTRHPSPLSDLRSLWHWFVLLRRVRPNVLSVGTPKAGLLGSLAGALARVPARVYVLRGLRLETARGPGRVVLALLERITAASSHTVVAVSPSLRDRYVALDLAPGSAVITLGAGSSNGVDLQAHRVESIDPTSMAEARRIVGSERGLPVIGFVGRLAVDKGLSVLAEARRELLRRGVAHRLLVVGGIDDVAGSDVAGVLSTDGSDVVVTGHVADPRPYYHCMDALCLPTYREGFPNVVLEAAASGVATVTTNATGAVDSVIDGETGYVVEVGSAVALADALERIIRDPARAREMGRHARERAEAEFERGHVWSAWSAFYGGMRGVSR